MGSILKEGDIIVLSEKKLIIKGIMGRGASSVAYYALGEDGTQHIIKEFNPRYCKLSRNSDDSIICNDKDQEEYQKGLIRFKASLKKQLEIRNKNGFTNITANIQNGIIETNNTAYIDMTYMDGKTFDSIKCDTLLDLIIKIRTICKIVSYYHSVDLLYLDLKPQNIYFNKNVDDYEPAILFDFDSVVSMDEIQSGCDLYYTDKWAAPELYLCSSQSQISKSTDIFSIGEMLYYKIFGNHSSSLERRCYSDYSYEGVSILEKINPTVLKKLTSIFRHTICMSPKGRYQDISDLISDFDDMIDLLSYKVYPRSTTIQRKGCFLGREKVVDEIIKRINENKNTSISGIGGIGKTQIAIDIAIKLKKTYTVIFAVYDESWIDLVVNKLSSSLVNYPRYQGKSDKDMQEYYDQIIFEYNKFSDENIVVIIDNIDEKAFDDREKENREKLLELNIKFLFTSRDNLEDSLPCSSVVVKEIDSLENKLQLFYHWSKIDQSVENDDIIKNIMDMVYSHTLAIELIARQCYKLGVSAEEMLYNLSNSGGKDVNIGILKDGSKITGSIEEIIIKLFRLYNYDNVNDDVLFFMTLMPISGMNLSTLRELLLDNEKDVIGDLVNSGWLMRNGMSISMHPLIAEAVRRQYRNVKKCIDLHSERIACYVEKIDELNISFISTGLESVITNVFNEMPDEITDNLARLYNMDVWSELLSNRKIIEGMYFKARAHYEEKLIFNNISIAKHYTCSDLDMAEKYLDKAEELTVRNNYMDFNHLGRIYYIRGQISDERKDSELALQYYMKACEREPLINPSKGEQLLYADVLSDIGQVYYSTPSIQNAYEKAYQYYNNSLGRVFSLYGEKSRHAAIRFHNLGRLYCAMSEKGSKMNYVEKAEENLLKAKEINVEFYGYYSIHVCINLNALSELYSYKGDYSKALDYAKQSFDITKEIYGNRCLTYTRASIFLAEALLCAERYEEARDLYNEAIDIAKDLSKNTGEADFYVADYKYRLACLYIQMKYYEEAEELLNETCLLFEGLKKVEYMARSVVQLGCLYDYIADELKNNGLIEESEHKRSDANLKYKTALGMFPDNESCKFFIDYCNSRLSEM